jgi:hypothetical protein
MRRAKKANIDEMKSRRFGTHEVTKGKFAGGLHVATPRFSRFLSELNYFLDYLNRRLLPKEPEVAAISQIITNLQNLLEGECDALIHHHANARGTAQERQFDAQVRSGFVAFKTKFEWLRKRCLVSQDERDMMEEIRRLRNDFVHAREMANRRRRHRYRGFPLLTTRSLRRLFVEVEMALRAMRKQSGRTCKWATVPPKFASECKWPEEYVHALEG